MQGRTLCARTEREIYRAGEPAAVRRARMAASVSSEPYMALPATSTVAPASATQRAVTGVMPPSTSSSHSGWYLSMMARTSRMVSS